MKDKTRAQIASLTQTRDTMVKLRTALKNKINNIFSAHGINLSKESLASEKGLKAVLGTQFDVLVQLDLKILGRTDPRAQQEHRRTGRDHQPGKPEIGRAQESDLDQGNRRAQRRHPAVNYRRYPRLFGRRQAGGVF